MRASNRQIVAAVLGIGLLVAVVAAVLLPAIPANEQHNSESGICTRCGLDRYHQQISAAGSPEQVLVSQEERLVTPLSQWHEDHYRVSCTHVWRRLNSSNKDCLRIGSWHFRVGAIAVGCSRRPELVDLSTADRTHLDDLFRRDPEACQQHITEQLQGSWSAAVTP